MAATTPAATMIDQFFPLVKRLGTEDWFSARVSACSLLATAYKPVGAPLRQELRQLFATMVCPSMAASVQHTILLVPPSLPFMPSPHE